MATFTQRSFAGGEVSPSLYSRVDTSKYASGLRTCRNFMVMRHGGASNRPGTIFVGEIKDSTNTARLIPFVFNASQTYILEFGNLYLRVIKNGTYVFDTSVNITGVTQAFPGVVTSTAHGLSNGDKIFISGIVGMVELNNQYFLVANATANTFTLQFLDPADVSTQFFTPYVSGGTAQRVYTISTTYAQADLALLQFVESADVVTIVHQNYPPAELKRTADASWTLTNIAFAPSILSPTNFSGLAGSFNQYAITTIANETFEESAPALTGAAGTQLGTPTGPITFSFTAASNAKEYNVYRALNGAYGFLGIFSGSGNYSDTGVPVDITDAPPLSRNPFPSSSNYPGVVSYIQQRLVFGNTILSPEKIWMSRSSLFHNYTTSTPLQADDAVTFTMAGQQVNEVRWIRELLGKMVVWTASGEWSVLGNSSGVITPIDINPKQHSYNGSVNNLPPIIVNQTALYVQARGTIVRDLLFDFQVDGYHGDDLTIFSSHLFDNYALSAWTFQRIPNSIVWAARNDGTLLGLTYVREHQIFAWHRHDFTGGFVETVESIPEGSEDSLYLIVRRVINGATKRYIEKLATRKINLIEDSIFMDSCISYDGTNLNVNLTMTVSGFNSLNNQATITSSASFFAATDIGHGINGTLSTGIYVRCTIIGFTSGTVVTVQCDKIITNVAFTSWSKAIGYMIGLRHLNIKNVSVVADGVVIANPNNPTYALMQVVSGKITFDKPYSKVHVGLPYVSDLQTLDIDVVQNSLSTYGETIADKQKLITRVSMRVESSRGIWAGETPPTNDSVNLLENLIELKLRENEDYSLPPALTTDVVDMMIQSTWDKNGRVFIRQIDPLPLAVLAIYPSGLLPIKGAY